ncbi:peptidoglycan-binding protein [Marinobacter sp. CA1]|nr:peptidoglycan-binding protein [Marinobacter sp. CA1]
MVSLPATAANDVVALKNALYGAGYDIRNVSASMDNSTRAALRAFQRDQAGLQVSGELDEPTKKALGMVEVKLAAAPRAEDEPVTASAAAELEPEDAVVEDDVIEEDEDGGWSFF